MDIPFVQFVYALQGVLSHVESFVFSTTLTRGRW